MKILALDIASTTGFARWSSGMNRPAAGVQVFAGDVYAKVSAFRKWLIAKVIADEITHLVVEEFAMIQGGLTNFETTKVLLTMNTTAGVVARDRGLYFETVPAATWRKHFIGMGRAPRGKAKPTEFLKARAVDRCRELGWEIPKHDAAEAAGLLDYARAKLDPLYGARSAELFRGAA